MRDRSAAACRGLVAMAALLGLAVQSPDALAQPAPPAPLAPPAQRAPAVVLVPPKLISEAVIEYPAGAHGDVDVVLTLTIDPDGRVISSKAVEPNVPFSTVAEAESLTWTFQPGTRNGKPITGVILFQVRFREPEPVPEVPPNSPSGSGTSTNPPISPASPKTAEPTKKKTAKAAALDEVTIVGDRGEPSRTATLTRAEVREIPGAFGDPFRAIEILPGVTPLVSGLPYFYVRGAPPGNVGYFLDGIRVPLLYHIGLGPSVVHPGLIERVDLYSGGYPAAYGRFAGGIVSGETNAPRRDWHGEGNVRLFDAGAMVEAPLPGNRGSILLGGRYSYTAALLSIAAPEVALSYWDYQGRINYDLTPKDRVTAFFFGSYDYLGQKQNGVTTTLFGTEFHRLDLRYDRALDGGGTNRLALTLGLDLSRISEGRYLRDRMIAVRQQASYPISPDVTIRGGVNATLDVYDVQLTNDNGESSRLSSLFPSRTDIALGAHMDAVIHITPKLEVIPGVRGDFYGSEGATAVAIDPRLSWRLELSKPLHMLASFGVAHQPPAFAIPVPGFQPGGLKGGLQTALQQSAGIEAELPAAFTATVTAFHNGFVNMSDPFSSSPRETTGCAPGSFPDDSLAADVGAPRSRGDCPRATIPEGKLGPDGSDNRRANQVASIFETRTQGSAYGIEVLIKRRLTQRLGGLISYTLSRSTRSVGRETFIANFDRTHVLNAAVGYSLGRRWRAGGRIMFYTGLPAAPDPTQADGGPSRLPSFYRLDLRLEKRWNPTPRISLSFVAEWMNATLRKETVATSCTLQGCKAQEIGPITIPSLGLEGTF